MEKKDHNKTDWDDDSGVIHTSYQNYKTSSKDGFQENHAYSMVNKQGRKNRYIKGTQIGVTYTTDDYRVVLPGYVFSTILMIVVTIILLSVNIMMGIIFGIFAGFFIYGFWKNAPIKKWKNQAKRRKSEKKNR